MPEVFDEVVLPEAETFDEIILPHDSGQFEQIVLPPQPKTETEAALAETPVFNPKNEQIRAAPTFFGELQAGRLGSAYQLAKEVVAQQFKGQPIEKGRGAGLLGTEEQIPASPDDALPVRAAKAFINVSNRTMAGLTGPEMLPLAVIGGAGGVTGKLIAGAFAGDIASHAPDTWKAIEAAEQTEPWSQERFEAGLDTVMQGLMLHGTARHAARPSKTDFELQPKTPEWEAAQRERAEGPARPQESSEAPPATTEPATLQTVGSDNPAQRMVPVEELPPTEVAGPRSARVSRAEYEAMKANLNELNKDQFLPDREEPIGVTETISELPKKTRMDLILDGVEKNGEVSVTIEGPRPTREVIQKVEAAAEARGMTAAFDGSGFLIRKQPVGITETLTTLNKELAPSTEPVIPNEPAGTKFAEPEIMSPGPGAASAKETLASYEQRRFGQRFQETEGIDPAIREETGNRYYEPISNKVTLEDASKIIDERGTDEAIRLVRDEKFEMEPRVRATLGQTLVQKLNQSHAEATAAGDAVRAKEFLNQAVDTAEYLGEFGTRLGQGVQSFAIWSRLTPEGMLESAKRSAKRANVELTPEQQAEIRRLAAEAHTAAEGIPKQDATKKLADYMVQQTGIPASDLPLSIYYTHILSGVQTHIVNAVDTALNVMHEVNNLAVTNPRAAASIYGGLMRGLGEGKYDGILSLQEGRRIASGKFIESPDLLEQSKFGVKGGVPIAVKGVASKLAKRAAEARIGVGKLNLHPLNAYKYVMRMMSASDAVFFRGAEEARAGLLAHRLAEASGAERANLKGEVDSILGYDRLPEFRGRAAKEGYTGAKQEARATELMIQSRPESLRADASDYAGVSTYNHAPRGVLGYFSNVIAQASNKFPALKLFVPFTRIVANVTNRGLDNTPLGIYRALKEKGLSKEERQRVMTRGIMGTAGLMGLGVLDATGAIQIHGAGPSDPEKKRQLRNAGWKPFSIQIGDKYYTYTYTPIGLGVSVLGNYLDSQRYNELSQKDALTRTAYAMSRIGQTVFSQSFLSGLSNLFTILSGDPGQSVSSLKQFFSNVATGATTPNLLRDVNHVFDPVARKSENIAQDLIRNIPVARLSLRPTLNAFGEPVELQRNRFFSSQSDDPAWKLAVSKNLRIPVVDQTTFVDSEDGYRYAKIAGERMRKYIVSNLQDLNRLTDQQAQDKLSKASRSMFDEARQDVVRHGGVKKKRIGRFPEGLSDGRKAP